jgi:hypothetical protein
MALIPGMLVTAPEPLRRRYGLFTAASGPVDLPSPQGQGGGVRYVPVTCGQAHPYPIGCYDGLVEVPEGGKPVDPDNAEVTANPFMVVASIECATVGYTAAEDEARVRRRLEAGEQGGAELALWTGLDPNGNSLDITSLAESAEDISTVADELSLAHVVAALEDYAYREQSYGYTAFIHAPVAVAAWAAEANLIVDDGPLMRTPYGSVWVFGGGYPGTGAAGGDAPPAGGSYMHVTGQVTVWRASEEHVYPVDQTMDKATNQRLLLAEREYAIGFDCFNGRAIFDPLGGVS